MESSLGIIGGGMMAETLIKGFLEKEIFKAKDIMVSEPVAARSQYLEEYYGIHTTSDNLEVLSKCSTIILAVKPQVMPDVLEEIKEKIVPEKHLIITIAAGLPIAFYEKKLPKGTRLIRVMPNTCALVHESISAIAKGSGALEKDLTFATEIFQAIGKVLIVKEEYMDAITALSGSGPAYVALFVEALIDAGVSCGLPRDVAETLTLQTIEGTIQMFRKTQKNPYQIKAMVTSPGGTTITALEVFYKRGFPGIIMEAVKNAWKRSRELSENLK
ncbi:MAG: pyrroline-5-carboxylate reductase [Caldimicrobium sp.]